MTQALHLLGTGLLFAAITFLGLLLAAALCANITPFEDGPRLSAHPPFWELVAAAGGLGVIIAQHAPFSPQVGLTGLILGFLAACWYCDVRTGIIPDVFTLIPLGSVIVLAVSRGEYTVLISSLVVFVPFAVLALASGGRGIGWADAKIAALSGALLGLGLAILAMIVASLSAGLITKFILKRNEPIAFAPYLVSAIAIAAVLQS